MADRVVVHISGASGSGKTTLGNKLKSRFGDKIIVKDLDELLDDYFANAFGKNSNHNLGDVDEKLYQSYIDEFVQNHAKPIVFVGLNDNFVDFYPKRKNMYYNVHAMHEFYIDISDDVIVEQKCKRFFDNVKNDVGLMKTITTNNKNFLKTTHTAIDTECSKAGIMKWVHKWKKDYKKQGFRFMDRNQIFQSVSKILRQALSKSNGVKKTKRNRKQKRSNTRRNQKNKKS